MKFVKGIGQSKSVQSVIENSDNNVLKKLATGMKYHPTDQAGVNLKPLAPKPRTFRLARYIHFKKVIPVIIAAIRIIIPSTSCLASLDSALSIEKFDD